MFYKYFLNVYNKVKHIYKTYFLMKKFPIYLKANIFFFILLFFIINIFNKIIFKKL